ncbi:MAG: hypothetical protein KF911_06210 [Pseudomonadales bacterium]|nr:hypothetical protein [Pseudomonadales bacterium]
MLMPKNPFLGVLTLINLVLVVVQRAGDVDFVLSRVEDPGWLAGVWIFLVEAPPPWFENLLHVSVVVLLVMLLVSERRHTKIDVQPKIDKPSDQEVTADTLAEHIDLDDDSYRELVAETIKAFEPHAEVYIGGKKVGPDGARSIGLEVRSTLGPAKRTTLIEVFDAHTARPAPIDLVDAVDSKRADFNADSVLICSNTGFDSAAIRKAKRKGIGLISVLASGNTAAKAVIEEEIYLRKIRVHPLNVQPFTINESDGPRIRDAWSADAQALRHNGGSVMAWLVLKAALIAIINPKLELGTDDLITSDFRFKKTTTLELGDAHVILKGFRLSFRPQVIWLSQVVRIDAQRGIYDYVRGRVRLAPGPNSQTISGIDFEKATPITDPPEAGTFFGSRNLAQGETDMAFVLVEGTGAIEPARLDELVVPEDLDLVIKEADDAEAKQR